ncbi:Uncharacterized protein MCB1EB_1596 [Mycoavidus cysteinexigens]|uniref:Uncharacterized protein n=1 Tax=Mycoavidus cysteinexigens TaxID=1553431 RepID=A0A2Z6EWC5_9BURK|nr:hypothetical protein [Mycoavidus cysteinexigens]BBE09757.1 Uncharacterized protein MCB1EB_1596 [Mycoavidus cysteinexigens]GLR02283.1 hypothetical protein GCM10007934_20990 [Mycoavidus cysteinexigens]
MGNIRNSESDLAVFIWLPEFDRSASRITLSELTEVNAYNANVCWQWLEQALGLKAFYRKLQHIQAMP